MKKILTMLIIIFALFICSCSKEELSFSTTNYQIKVAEQIELKPLLNGKETIEKISYSVDNDVIEVDNNIIIGKKEGTAIVTASYNSSSVKLTIIVEGYLLNIINAPEQIFVGDEVNIETDQPESNILWSVDSDIASIEAGKLTARSQGTVVVSATLGSYTATVTIEIVEKTLDISYQEIMEVGESQTIEVAATPDVTPIFSSSNEEVLTIDELGTITAISKGEATITVEANGITKEAIILVSGVSVNKININNTLTFLVGKVVKMDVQTFPEEAAVSFVIENPEIASIDDEGNLTALKKGKTSIIVKALDKGGFEAKFEIEVVDTDKKRPTIYINEEEVSLEVSVNYNTPFDPMYGVYATDDIDGDITSKIVIEGYTSTAKMGTQTITYSVTDEAGNKARALTRTLTVYWDYPITFIGHMGSYSGVANTEEAFINAVRVHGYQALECDIKQTKDGVFVLCHDDSLDNYGNKGVKIAEKTYAELEKLTLTQTRGGIKYESKICTLERYLQICRSYDVIAVIELKSSTGISGSDTSRMQALMDVISKAGMLEQVILLGSNWTALKWTRENGYENVKCQYLVTSISNPETCETYFNRCVEYNFDISFSIDGVNNQEWIKKYQDAGHKVACYTFSQYSTPAILQEWINLGVDYVTVDVIKPSEVILPTE